MIRLISHRGNIDGIFEEMENEPSYIDRAIGKCGLVEVDLRFINGLYWLGHDSPEHVVTLAWLKSRSENLIVHCKDVFALEEMMGEKMMCFFHQNDNHTPIYGSEFIWSHAVAEASSKSIIPLMSKHHIDSWTRQLVYGICSDEISYLEEFLSNK